MRAPGVFLLSLFASCVTRADLDARINTWLGKDVNALALAWGAPTNSFKLPNGQTLYEFSVREQGSSYSHYSRFSGTVHTTNSVFWCKSTFIADPAFIIVSARWQGNACESQIIAASP